MILVLQISTKWCLWVKNPVTYVDVICARARPSVTLINSLKAVGPLASFEGLLSMYGKNFSMFNDMIVAVEDLRNVEFSLVLVQDHGIVIKKGSSGKQV